MRISPETLPSRSSDDPTSLVNLTTLVYDGVSLIREKEERFRDCLCRFHEISGFSSLRVWENVFTEMAFTHSTPVATPYGVINSYDISQKLKQNLINRNPSLRQLCIVNMCEVGPPLITTDTLLLLPDNLFRMFFITAFSTHWIPMSNVDFHDDLNKTQKIPSSLRCVFELLSTPRIFERMFDDFREILMFIVCWMQHGQFHARGVDDRSQSPGYARDSPTRAGVGPHQFSERLVRVLKSRLAPLRASALPDCSSTLPLADNAVSCLLFGLKVAHFLCDSSEYVHAVRAARFTKSFIQTIKDEQTRLWLEHELYCIMLRSMNSHVMYAQKRNRLVFERDVPQFLMFLYHSNLLICQWNPQTAQRFSVLPYECGNDSNGFDVVKVGNLASSSSLLPDCGAEIKSRNQTSNVSGKFHSTSLGPGGDTVNSVAFNPNQRVFHGKALNGGFLYAQLATYHYAMCRYDKAFQFTVLAIQQIRACLNNLSGLSGYVVVEVLRIVCKLCMIKRDYKLAFEIIKSALCFTARVYGDSSLIYANVLLDYGCLLINTDKTSKAARVYAIALALIFTSLPGSSIMCALILEALAYAHYVLEYTTGHFDYASKCANAATHMLRQLKYHDCMQTASANRVKALIVEEIAIDSNDPRCFKTAEKLHIRSLNCCLKTYGEHNIQTAKHYGNLGRLYQSMRSYTKAEENHKKAIKIKTDLLGESDFEVALSLGHLASLYNYDMKRYSEAEKLHLKSVSISQEIFGPTYSGLEYEYRGLQRIYHQLGFPEKEEQYVRLLDDWRAKREQLDPAETTEQTDEIDPFKSADNFHVTEIVRLLTVFEEAFSKIFV